MSKLKNYKRASFSDMVKGVKYHEDFPEMLVEHMASGMSFATFGAVVGVAERKLYEWCDDHPEFSAARDTGKLLELQKYETTASAKSNGELDEETYKVTDANLLKFMMSNKFRDKYNNRQEIEGNFNLKDILTKSVDKDS